MKRKLIVFPKIILLLFFTQAVQICVAQDVERTDRGVKITANETTTELQFFNNATVRVLKYRAGEIPDAKSLSVIAAPEKTVFSMKRSGDRVQVISELIDVSVSIKDGQVTFTDPKRKNVFVKEKAAGTSIQPFDDAGVNAYSVSQSFVLDQDEAIYGLGQQQRGKMIQRNLKMMMVQGNTDDYVTFFQSVKGYGIFWDNYSPTTFEDNSAGTSFSSQVGDGVDYYFMYGGNADGVIRQMRYLTGEAPMFPLWTYGFWQSKERYKSQAELVDVVRKYRQLHVPLDGVIQDWQYWGSNYLWNAMDFLNADFPDPARMVKDIHGMNAHMIISIWSSFGPHTLQYRELDSIKALFNIKTWPESGSDIWPPNMKYPSGVRVYDPYNPAARAIYWKYLKNMHTLGIDGWWMDSSEPDHFNATDSDLNTKTFLGSFRRVRNAYPLMTVGGVYDNQRKVDSSKRVFILTRSAFAGQQRYGANTWSGDVVASWNALHNQITAGLNFSLTGIPHWNSDIGGFFLWNFRKKLDDPEYRELYTRWLQFGAFTPMMRSHGADAPREIWQFGKKGDKVYDAIEKFIRLRYSLLPYIYSSSYQVTANQSTMMRALMMDFPADKTALPVSDEFMFGRSLLVCPVVKPMYVKPVINNRDTSMAEDFSAVRSREVYLPAGTNWFDFWTNEQHTGGQMVMKETPLDLIPVYVKAGSVLPVGPSVQYATERKWDELEIRVYPGANGEFVLYEDENDNYNYEKGIFSTITFRWDDKKKTLSIADRKGTFPGMLSNRKFNIVLMQQQAGNVSSVSYDGKQVKIKL